MRTILSWITDPCVHLFAIGLLLVHLSMSGGADPEVAVEELPACVLCKQLHGAYTPCPVIVSQLPGGIEAN